MITGVVLAAGRSQRMGQPKLLLPWRGHSIVRAVVETALRSRLDRVVVVTGYRAEHVAAALESLPIDLIPNDSFLDGQSTSLHAGITAAGTAAAIVVLLADQPLVQPATIDALIAAFERDGSPIVVPRYHGQRGNPVLLARPLFPELLAIEGDQGARPVLQAHADQVAWIDVDDLGVTLDIDTPDGYARLVAEAM